MYAARAREVAARAGDTDSLQLAAGARGQVLLDCGEYEAARESLERDMSSGGSGTSASRPPCSGLSPGSNSGPGN